MAVVDQTDELELGSFEEQEEEDPYELYVLRRPHERSSAVVPQLPKQPEYAETRLRYRRIPAEARSGSLCSLGNHFPRRFEFPNRPSLLESLTSDEESCASLCLESVQSFEMKPFPNSRSSQKRAHPKKSQAGNGERGSRKSEVAKAKDNVSGNARGNPRALDLEEALLKHGEEAHLTKTKKKKKRAPKPPLPRPPPPKPVNNEHTSIIADDVSLAISPSSLPTNVTGLRSLQKKKSREKSQDSDQFPPPPIMKPSEVNRPAAKVRANDSDNSGSKKSPSGASPRKRVSRPGTPVSRPDQKKEFVTTSSSQQSHVGLRSIGEGRFSEAEAYKARERRPRVHTKENPGEGQTSKVVRTLSHDSGILSAPKVFVYDDAPIPIRSSSTGGSRTAFNTSPASFTEWEGRRICPPAVLNVGCQREFKLLVEEPVLYSHDPKVATAEYRAFKRRSRRGKKMSRTSMRFRRSVANLQLRSTRRQSKPRTNIAPDNTATRRSPGSNEGVERDRELSVSMRFQPTPHNAAKPTLTALTRVLQALRLSSRPAERRSQRL